MAGIVLIDVSGHRVTDALLAAMLQTITSEGLARPGRAADWTDGIDGGGVDCGGSDRRDRRDRGNGNDGIARRE